MYLYDCHTHTKFSPDGLGEMNDMLQSAINRNLNEIYFTDHLDIGDYYQDLDLESYSKKIVQLKDLYSDKIKIKLGIEFGLQPDLSEQFKSISEKYKFDLIIGSTHMVNKMDICYHKADFFGSLSQKDAYLSYFEEILKSVNEINEFDIYGHLDYVIRYGDFENKCLDYETFQEILDEILMSIIKKGKGIEINTSGYRYGLGSFHPNIQIVKRYKELGGQIITIGSDAHTPEHIAYEFKKANNMLKELGFKYITTFENRKPEFVKI